MSATRRINKELADIAADPPDGITTALGPNDDLHYLRVTITGPADTPYADGIFGLEVRLPTTYPFKPPTVRFVTKIYHPNITNDTLGNVCLGLLKSENWKPSTTLRAVFESIRLLLVEPQPNDPLEAGIAEQFLLERDKFVEKARSYVSQYAQDAPQF